MTRCLVQHLGDMQIPQKQSCPLSEGTLNAENSIWSSGSEATYEWFMLLRTDTQL